VEVHGGASLEEVVVPIIEVVRLHDKIEIINKTPITTTSFKKMAEIILFCKYELKDVSVVIDGHKYLATSEGNNHVIIFKDPPLKKGMYKADVYEGDAIISIVEFEVIPESGGVKKDEMF